MEGVQLVPASRPLFRILKNTKKHGMGSIKSAGKLYKKRMQQKKCESSLDLEHCQYTVVRNNTILEDLNDSQDPKHTLFCRENAFVAIYALLSDNKCALFAR